jgi:hypothetical protein
MNQFCVSYNGLNLVRTHNLCCLYIQCLSRQFSSVRFCLPLKVVVHLGLILPTFYELLLRVQIPKSQKNTVKLSVFFALSGSACIKAACKMLVKLTLWHRTHRGSRWFRCSPWDNSWGKFHQHSTNRFFVHRLKKDWQFDCKSCSINVEWIVCLLCPFGICASKSCRMLMKLRDQVSISSTYLRAAFTPVAPKVYEFSQVVSIFFTLLGSAQAKAACWMLMKLTDQVSLSWPFTTSSGFSYDIRMLCLTVKAYVKCVSRIWKS